MGAASRTSRTQPVRDRSVSLQQAASEEGFTLAEVIVASFVLLVGMLGVVTLLVGSLRRTEATNEQVGATNLARELIEATRGLGYGDMSGTTVQARLQAAGFGSGTPWTIERRRVTYTVTATSCTFDDPGDQLAATPPAGVCTPQPTGTTGDANGDDFRRTTFRIAWTRDAVTRALTQTTLVVNPSGGLGPRVVAVTPVAQTMTASDTAAYVTWTTTPAQTLRWVVDDGTSGGSVSGSTSFTTGWNLGTSGSGTEVLDGSYQITGQPFDDLGVAGEVKRANVLLNRRQPYAPPTLAGGHDTRLGDWVDLEWTANRERDVLGYRAMWAGPDGVVGNGDDTQECPPAGSATMLDPTVRSCQDLSPPAGATKYYAVAIDRDASNQLRAGDRRTLSIGAPSARPRPPLGLAVLTSSGQPVVLWLPPLGGASFYRIYRDGARYDRAPSGTLSYTDSDPGTTNHQYQVTAVDSTYNESDAVGPVIWTQ